MAGQQFGFGSGVLYGTRTDVVNSTPRRFGTMQDVSIDFNGEIKELYGQLQYPVDTARGKVKIEGKAKFATISAATYNDLFFGQASSTGQVLSSFNETGTPPTSAPVTVNTSADSPIASPGVLTFASTTTVVVGAVVTSPIANAIPAGTTVASKTTTTVTLSGPTTVDIPSGTTITFQTDSSYTVANGATFLSDLGVLYSATGLPLKYVSGTPTTVGTYTVNTTTGQYQVSPADAGVPLLFSYTYNNTSGITIQGTNLLMGTTPRFSAVFSQAYNGQQTTLQLFACVSSKLTLPTKIDDYVIAEMDFMAFANPAGQVFSLGASS